MSESDLRPWRVLGRETLHTNPWFEVASRDVQLPDGTRIDFRSIEFHRPAVAVVARSEGRTLLVRQYRLTIDREVWAIPSGGVDEDEGAEAAARRELLEETGYTARSLRPVVAYHPSYGATNQLFQTYVAEDLADTGKGFDGNEVIEVRWFEDAEVLRMLFDNEMLDGLSATPLALLFLEDELRRSGGERRLRGVLPD